MLMVILLLTEAGSLGKLALQVEAGQSLTKRHHAAEAANVGVELLNALDQLIARINVNACSLVGEAL
jgi:hypothetical protein